MATTVQQIIDRVTRDQQAVIGAGHPALVDYTDRVHHEILRRSKWLFLLSSPQTFITKKGVSDYWVGATGGEPDGALDTLLNITDMGSIKERTVLDRSNRRVLKRTSEKTFDIDISDRDSQLRLARPRQWRQDQDTADVLNLLPAPDNENNFVPSPLPPLTATATSGALPERTYFVKITIVDSKGGESQASVGTEQFIVLNDVLVVKTPVLPFTVLATGVTYVGYNVYASEVENSEQLQNATFVAFGTDFTEPTGGLITGAEAPSSTTLQELDGYVMEFKYYKLRKELTLVSDVIQVPDRYKDVVVAGVNAFAAQYLSHRDTDAQTWGALYEKGIKGMIRDSQLIEGEQNFIHPDPASIQQSIIGDDPVQQIFFSAAR